MAFFISSSSVRLALASSVRTTGNVWLRKGPGTGPAAPYAPAQTG